MILFYPDFVLCNVYFPNGGRDEVRLKYKLDYYEHFLKFVKGLDLGKRAIIICGDVNTAHLEIDLARPKENSKISGFLPEERAWLDKFFESGFIDSFRVFNKEPEQYTWWDQKSRARDRNIGWRIDYFFVDFLHKANLKSARIDAATMGSDHCPIEINCEF